MQQVIEDMGVDGNVAAHLAGVVPVERISDISELIRHKKTLPENSDICMGGLARRLLEEPDRNVPDCSRRHKLRDGREHERVKQAESLAKEHVQVTKSEERQDRMIERHYDALGSHECDRRLAKLREKYIANSVVLMCLTPTPPPRWLMEQVLVYFVRFKRT